MTGTVRQWFLLIARPQVRILPGAPAAQTDILPPVQRLHSARVHA